MRPIWIATLWLWAPGWAAGITLFAAGDIAHCRWQEDERTARLIETLALPHRSWAVLALGDLAYPRGRDVSFARCYEPSWGRFRDRTHPVPGNHEYYTRRAAGYFGYFGPRARPPLGYYRFAYAGWSLYALNSERPLGPDSDQLRWLEDALVEDPNPCRLAFLHRPRYSSGMHGDAPELEPLWALLRRTGFALVLAGHDHHYERIETGGPVQLVVGTGGAPLREVKRRRPGSRTYVDDAHGVLELTLHPRGYRFRFVDLDLEVRDQGLGFCTR